MYLAFLPCLMNQYDQGNRVIVNIVDQLHLYWGYSRYRSLFSFKNGLSWAMIGRLDIIFSAWNFLWICGEEAASCVQWKKSGQRIKKKKSISSTLSFFVCVPEPSSPGVCMAERVMTLRLEQISFPGLQSTFIWAKCFFEKSSIWRKHDWGATDLMPQYTACF